MGMNVAELFAGVGGFRLGLERSDKDFFNTVWMNQWEPSKKEQDAFNCYEERFKEGEKSNEDIGNVDMEKLQEKNIDMIVGGFPCFSKGTFITTSEGIKRIEDVKKGDKVLTHKNRFRKVVKTMKRKKRGLYDLKVQGSPYTEVTEEHPVYIRKKERIWNKDKKRYDLKWTEPFWEEVKNLKKGVHYVGMIIDKNKSNNENVQSHGYYLGGMMWMPIKNIQYKEHWEGIVYNFEVDTDNSYVANNLTVHNCQDYSVARSSKGKQGIEGKKGVLFWDIIRMVEELKPKHLLLENVDRLLITPSEQRGRDFAVMLAAFRDLGYYVEWRIINAAHYGGSQRRKRIFIYVVKKEHGFAKQMKKENKYDLLYKKGFFAHKFEVRKSLFRLKLQGIKLEEDIVKVSDNFEGNFETAGIMIDGVVYTSKVRTMIEPYTALGDVLEKDVSDEYYLTDEEEKKFKYLRGKKEIERETEDGFKYIYKEGKMSEIDEMHLPSRTILTSEGSVS